MKLHRSIVNAAAVFAAGLALAAEPYDEKLEFIESSGTQWIDTGIKLHWKRSSMRLDFRVLEAPASVGSGVTIAGVTGAKDARDGWTSAGRKSFVMSIGQPSAGKFAMWPSFAGGNNNGGYRVPDDGVGTDEYNKSWGARSEWRETTYQSVKALRQCFVVDGLQKGGYYDNYADAWSDYSFYIGVANNAGEGLFDAEGSLAKLHWYGVKLYTDDELVGDFIPVKKNGVAGFYDNVSEQFFPSQGADPWIAPTTVEWTGNGQEGNLTDGDNWAGGAAPSSVREVAVIPDGMSVTGSVETVAAAFNDIGGVRLAGVAARLHLCGMAAATTIRFPVSGLGQYVIENVSSSTVIMTTKQTLQNFYGTAYISNIYFTVTQPYCLGDKARSVAEVYLGGGSQRFSITGSGLYGKVILRKCGQFVFLVGSGYAFYDYADWYFPTSNTPGFHGNGTATWNLFGKVVGRLEDNANFWPNSMTALHLRGEDKYLNLSQLQPDMKTLSINCPVHSMARAKDAAGAGQNQANIKIYSGRTLRFGYPNTLDTNCFVQVGYADNPSVGKTNLIDLAGYDQRLGTLGVWASGFDPSQVWNENLMITSAAPATLTVYGQLRTSTGDSLHVFPGRVMGETSIALNSLQSVMEEAWSWPDATVPGGIRFNCPGSETSGYLSSARGTLEVMETATFPNLSGIVVSGTGVVKLSTSEVGTENSQFCIAVKDAAARLELVSGVSVACNTFEIPGGQYLAPGFYSENASEGVKACAYITGAGIVEVRNAKWTGWSEVGTATEVTIPPGTAVVIKDEDIARVEALDEIATAESVTISIETTLPLDISAAISGPAVITASGAGKVTLSGDNSGLVAPGHFEFTAMANGVEVANFFGLGGTNTATDVFTQSSGYLDWLTFKSENGVFTNSAPIQLVHGSGGTHRVVMGAENAGDVLVFANDVIMGGTTGENHWYVTNGVRFVDGKFMMGGHVRLNSTAGATLEFIGESEAEFGRGGDQSILYFSGVVFGGKSVWAANGLATDYDRNIQVVKPNCLGTNCVVRAYPNGTTKPHFDFNGCDQEISRLAQSGSGSQSPKLTSTDPATLHAMGPTPSYQATVSLRYIFTGALGYWHDVAQNLTLVAKSTSSGDLKVTKGVLTFSDAGGWAGRYVTVGNGGTLVCGAENSLNSGTHIVDVESGGTLVVSNGVTVKVASMTFGDVALPQNSTFTVAEVNELIAGSGATLTGGGTIQTGAKSIPGEWTGWPEVGTATKAVVPDDVVAEVTDADLPKLAALQDVECGVGAKIVFKTTADFIDLTAKFSGGVEVDVFTDGARVVLNADNSGLVSPGAFVFSNTTVVVSNRYGLGSVAASPATFWPAVPFTSDSNKSYLYFDGPDAVTNDCALLFNYGCQMGHLDPAVRFVQANNVVQKGGSTSGYGRFGLRNDLTLAAGCTLDIGASGTSSADGSTFRIEEGATVKASGNFGGGTYRIAGYYSGTLSIEQGMREFVFERADTISTSSYLRYYDASYGTFKIDLNGFDQSLLYIFGNQYWNSNQQTLTVTSAEPATLTVLQDAASSHGVAMRFLDQASFAKCGVHTQVVGCATSTTKGTLTVNAGAVALERNAKWTGGDVVLNGGALIVRESAMTNTFGVGRATVPNLYVNGGKLRLEASEEVPSIRRIYVNGLPLGKGVYSAANCDWIEGEGSIRAMRSGQGALLIVR